MAESAKLHDSPLPQALGAERIRTRRRAWEKIKSFLSRSIFWPYQRGSWQYDIICALILAFIFFTPPAWFHDRPTLGLTTLRHSQGIIEMGHAKDGWHYLVDARVVASLAPLKPEDAIREILEKRLHETVNVKSVYVLRDRNNVILGYTAVLSH